MPFFRSSCLVLAVLALGLAQTRALAQSGASAQTLPVVGHVDWQRYGGKWYELARLPNSFQRKCVSDVTAEYTATADGNLLVSNACQRDSGELDIASGEARRVSGDAGMLKVRFAPHWLAWLPLVWGQYFVIALDEDYQTALVGTPDREYLWLLSRSPQRPQADVDAWLQRAAALGFDIERVARTVQTAENPSTGVNP